jgi:hypothetical protein
MKKRVIFLENLLRYVARAVDVAREFIAQCRLILANSRSVA